MQVAGRGLENDSKVIVLEKVAVAGNFLEPI